jgi:hypothetical protein
VVDATKWFALAGAVVSGALAALILLSLFS